MSISLPSILNACIDGILAVSDKGNADFINSQFILLWKIPADISSSKSYNRILKCIALEVHDPDTFIKKYSQIHPQEQNSDEISLIDGRTLKSYCTSVTDDNGLFTGRIWFFTDITKEKEDQKMIQHQQKIITKSARMSALGEMAGGIAHEINNPLSIIFAHAEMLLDADIEKLSASFIQKTAEKIKDTSKRIASIITGLRIFSRNSDKDPLAPVFLENVIEDTIAICIEKFKTNAIKVVFENPEKKLQVKGRASQLMQVILNLLNNAVDAVGTQTDKWITVTLRKNIDRIEVSVIDSGHGIDQLLLEKIFQPFFTTKLPEKGTGLGLSISRGIIEEHGGVLDFNQNSIHTCFTIQLPLLKRHSEVSSRENKNG